MKILGPNKYFHSGPVVFLFPNLPPESLFLIQMLSTVSVTRTLGLRESHLFPGEAVLSRGCWNHHLTEGQGALTKAGFVLYPSKRSFTCGPTHKHHDFSFLSSSAKEENIKIKFHWEIKKIIGPLRHKVQLNPTPWAGKQIFYMLGEVWQVGKYFSAELSLWFGLIAWVQLHYSHNK